MARPLRGALEALFRARAANDVLSLAETQACLLASKNLPELGEPGIDVLELGLSTVIEPIREAMPELLPLLRECFDLSVDLCDGHVVYNGLLDGDIPAAVAPETSLVAELGDAVLVEPEVVRELVEDGHPDLLLELPRVGKAVLER